MSAWASVFSGARTSPVTSCFSSLDLMILTSRTTSTLLVVAASLSRMAFSWSMAPCLESCLPSTREPSWVYSTHLSPSCLMCLVTESAPSSAGSPHGSSHLHVPASDLAQSHFLVGGLTPEAPMPCLGSSLPASASESDVAPPPFVISTMRRSPPTMFWYRVSAVSTRWRIRRCGSRHLVVGQICVRRIRGDVHGRPAAEVVRWKCQPFVRQRLGPALGPDGAHLRA